LRQIGPEPQVKIARKRREILASFSLPYEVLDEIQIGPGDRASTVVALVKGSGAAPGRSEGLGVRTENIPTRDRLEVGVATY